MLLHDARGKRLYVTSDERRAFSAAAAQAPRPVRSLCAVLHDTGCRISEALALTPERVTSPAVPASLLDAPDMLHGVREAQRRGRGHADRPLWPWARNTAWRHVKAVMTAVGIPDGPHRTPKGLRHGFGVHAIACGVPLNMLSKWMGHATLEVTAIYANALGAEEQGIAARMWK